MVHLLFALIPSVIQCDADPTGRQDSGPAFRACLQQHPAGAIFIPGGTFRVDQSIILNRNQSLIGMGSKSSVLKCSGTSSPCVVIADSSFGPNNYAVTNIEKIGIEGPGASTRSIGVYLGGDPAGRISDKNAFADSVVLSSVRITAFKYGIQWGNNAYADKIQTSSIYANDTGLFVSPNLTNSGEAIGITDSTIFNNSHNAIEDHGNFEWMIQGSSFDYNGAAIQFYGAHIHIANCHFEQEQAPVFFEPYGSADLSIRDSTILVQAAAGSDKYILSTWPQSLHLVIDDVSVWSNHPIQFFVHMQGSMTGSVTNLYGNGNNKIDAFSESSKAAALPASQPF